MATSDNSSLYVLFMHSNWLRYAHFGGSIHMWFIEIMFCDDGGSNDDDYSDNLLIKRRYKSTHQTEKLVYEWIVWNSENWIKMIDTIARGSGEGECRFNFCNTSVGLFISEHADKNSWCIRFKLHDTNHM